MGKSPEIMQGAPIEEEPMGGNSEAMIINGDGTFSLGTVRDFYLYPDGLGGLSIDSEKYGVIEIRYTGLQFEVQKNPATPNFEQIYVDVLPKCRFSQS